MSTYVNNTALEDLFASVEVRPDPLVRVEMIRGLQAEFVRLAVDTLEKVVYELADRGWTIHQIADETGVSRSNVARMAGAYAKRSGRLSPFPHTRSYDHAIDISRQVSMEARRRAAESPQG